MRDWSYFSTVMLPGEDIAFANDTLNETMKSSITYKKRYFVAWTETRDSPSCTITENPDTLGAFLLMKANRVSILALRP